jgi:hypothetical protein
MSQKEVFYCMSENGCKEKAHENMIYECIKPPTKYLNYAIISAWKKEMQEH